MNWRDLLSRKWLLLTLLLFVAAGVCVRLGIWQLDRLKQRRAFNSHIYALQAMAPARLPADAGQEDLPNMEYRSATATGIYDPGHQFVIRNQYNNSQVGYDLVTPLVMQNGEAVLVDRGWIPADGNEAPAGWHRYDVPGTVTVNGVIRASQAEPAPGLLAAADPTLTPGQKGMDQWIYVNIPRIAKQMPYPLLPVYLQQNPDPSRSNPPIASQVQLDLSDGPHLSYAIQWFSFAAIMLVGYPFYIRRQEKSKT